MLKVAMSYLSKEDAEDALHDIIERIGQKNKDDFSKLRDNKKGFFVVIARNHLLRNASENGASFQEHKSPIHKNRSKMSGFERVVKKGKRKKFLLPMA
jgi:hypothetical protein